MLTIVLRKRFDTSRFILEHYVDGDLVNNKTETKTSLATPDGLHIWGKFSTTVLLLPLIPPPSTL